MSTEQQQKPSHIEHLVDIVAEDGSVVGQKKRAEVNKRFDLVNTIFLLVCTGDGKVILSEIPDRTDLNNLYVHTLGATAATIRRHQETAQQAAVRAARHELQISMQSTPQLLGNACLDLPQGRKNFATTFLLKTHLPITPNGLDSERMQPLSQHQINEHISAGDIAFAPTFLGIWDSYQDKIADAMDGANR